MQSRHLQMPKRWQCLDRIQKASPNDIGICRIFAASPAEPLDLPNRSNSASNGFRKSERMIMIGEDAFEHPGRNLSRLFSR